MTLEQFLTILLKQWKLILACFVVVGSGAYFVSKFSTPLYQSTVLVQVSIQSGNNQTDYASLLASDQLVQTESQLAVSDPVLREVASHYPGMSVDLLSKEVTVTVKTNTQLFVIDVLDASPARAAALANDVAATLISQQVQVAQQEDSRSQQQIQQELDNTQQQIDDTTARLTGLQAKGGKQAEITVLEVKLNGLQQHYSQWQTLLAQLGLTQAQHEYFLRVVQPALPATSPARPQVLITTVAGLGAGLLLGLLLALLFEQLDTRIRTSESLAQILDWPVLATVWRVNLSKNKKNKKNEEELLNPPVHSPNIEAYRILRTSIGFSVIDKPLRSILVTSVAPKDGKSTIAANLAIFIAKAGKNTLLIDADLRRPSLHEKFHLPADKMGLSNAVLALSQLQHTTGTSTAPHSGLLPVDFSLAPYMHAVGIPNLRVMPSGPLPPNPPELLDSRAMERLFKELAHCGAEMIIFDTPPLLGLSDTRILAPKVDGTLAVVDISRANKKSLKQFRALLEQAGTRVLGCVLNKQRHSRKDTTYSYYYAYYYRNEEPRRAEKQPGNGHTPSVPLTPVPPLPSSRVEPGMSSN